MTTRWKQYAMISVLLLLMFALGSCVGANPPTGGDAAAPAVEATKPAAEEAAATTGTLHARMSQLVITSAFTGIVQNFESFCRFFERTGRLFIVRIAVRMIFQGQLLIGLLEFFRSRSANHAKNFVVTTLRCHLQNHKEM